MRLVFLFLIALIAGSINSTSLSAQTADTDQPSRSQNGTRIEDGRNSRVFDSYRRGMRTTTIVRVRKADDTNPITTHLEQATGPRKSIRTVRFDSPIALKTTSINRNENEQANRLASTNNHFDNTSLWRPKPFSNPPSQTLVRDLIYKQPKVDHSVWQDGGDEFSGFGVDSFFNSSSSCNEWKSFCQIKNGTYLNPCFALRAGDGDCCDENCTKFSFSRRHRSKGCRAKGKAGCVDCVSK